MQVSDIVEKTFAALFYCFCCLISCINLHFTLFLFLHRLEKLRLVNKPAQDLNSSDDPFAFLQL